MIDQILKSAEKFAWILWPAAVFLFVLFVGVILRKIIINRLNRWAAATTTKLDDIIIESIRKPFLLWCLMLAVYFAMDASTLPDETVHVLGKILMVLGIMSVTLALSSFSTRMIREYSARVASAMPVASLTQNLARIAVFVIGIMVILSSLGISITPLLATLGVGSLAVALGLQDTLSNLFAGFYVVLSRQVRVGDFVRLETGEEGYVIDINWRMTKIRMLSNNVILMPNEKLTKTVIVNYHLPDKELAVTMNMGVHYSSDLDTVERVVAEVGREVMKQVPGGVPEFEPFIRFHSFNSSSIDFSVILRAKEYTEQYLIKHEFVKRLHKRFAKEGIVIPYPITAVNYDQEKARTV